MKVDAAADLAAEVAALLEERDVLVGNLAVAVDRTVGATEAVDAARAALDRAIFAARSAKGRESYAAGVLARHDAALREAKAELAALPQQKET